MLCFQLSSAKASSFSDMPPAVKKLSEMQGYSSTVGKYSDAQTGRVYERLLVKRESDGKLFDYRMHGENFADEKNWSDVRGWNAKLGSNFGVEVDGVKSESAAPKQEISGFMKTWARIRPEAVIRQEEVRKDATKTKLDLFGIKPKKLSEEIEKRRGMPDILKTGELSWIFSLAGQDMKNGAKIRSGFEALSDYMERNCGESDKNALASGFGDYLKTHRAEFEKAYSVLTGDVKENGFRTKFRSYKTHGSDEDVLLITLASFAAEYLTAGNISHLSMLALAGQESNWSQPVKTRNGRGPFQLTRNSSVNSLGDKENNWIGRINTLLSSWGAPLCIGDGGYVGKSDPWRSNIAYNGLASMETLLLKTIEHWKEADLTSENTMRRIFKAYNGNVAQPEVYEVFGDSVLACRKKLGEKLQNI